MRRIAHRELRNHSSRVLNDVKNGATIEITNHGEVVAVLIPPTASPYERLVAAGKVEVADRAGTRFSDIRASRTDRDTIEVLDEMRGG
jgi:prevent-host-death family protein